MKTKKIKWSNLFCFLLGSICFLCFLYAIIHILIWKRDYQKIEEVSKEILDSTEVQEIEKNPEIITNDSSNSSLNAYEILKNRLIQVDFEELKKMNSDTIGWISVPNTNINYPFVQTSNNEFYLNHAFDKSLNGAGWIFLDYRNHLKEEQRNTILYAHGGSNTALFGSLKKILTKEWQSNLSSSVIKLSTETENTLWQIFSAYQIPTTSDYLQIHFPNDDSFGQFVTHLKNRSSLDFHTSVVSQDKILTLSTCSNNDEKIVVHAKLIKREARN